MKRSILNFFCCTSKLCGLYFLLVAWNPQFSYGQKDNAVKLTEDDYSRAIEFLWENINNKKVFNLNVRPGWFGDSTGFWFTEYFAGGKSFRKVAFARPEIQPLFDHKKLAGILSDTLGKKINPDSLPFNRIEYISSDTIGFLVNRTRYLLDLNTYRIHPVKEIERGNPDESMSPDGRWIAFTRDYNLFIRDSGTGEEYQLSNTGRKNYEYASYYGWYDLMEGENDKRPTHFSVNWSPDSKYIQAFICDLRSAQKMYLLDWSVDTLYRPRLLGYYRGSPGDTAMVYMIPVFYNVEEKEEITLGLPRNTHINTVSFQWSGMPGMVIMRNPERGYQKEELSRIDLGKRSITSYIIETSNTNIDNFNYWLVEKSGKIIFTSERSGWKQLYVYMYDNNRIEPLTQGDFFVNDVLHIDVENDRLYFTASGKEPGRNPYHQHLYKISLNGGDATLLTPDNAHHDIDFSPCGRYFLDNISSARIPSRTVLCEASSGQPVVQIAQADIEALEKMGWHPPEIFEAVARDGETIIYGALWKPTDFDPGLKYPVIDNSYTGPHTQMFPKEFQRVVSMENQALAEFGFVVVMVDGMGTAGRSKAFHDVSYKQMGFNLTDHVLAIQQLGRKYRWIDTTRVGIFGHSAGGYDAGHAVLQFPDFYKVAVASSADHDHRMEKAWWPEMYMGWPVDTAYHQQSNITMAPNLKGKLLLVHGGLDDNVNPSATFKLAEALVRADKEFDLLILPSQRHGYRGEYRIYFTKKRWNYFIEHLLGAEPLWNFKWNNRN